MFSCKCKRFIICIMSCLFIAGCSNTDTSSRVYESRTITSGDSTTFSVETESLIPSTSETNINPNCKINEKYTTIDHGKRAACVYRVKCGCRQSEWEGNDIWKPSYISTDWCYGRTFSSAPEENPKTPGKADSFIPTYSTLSYSNASQNILNFDVVHSNQLSGIQSIPEDVVNIPADCEMFAYKMSMENYPWEYEFSFTKELKIDNATVYFLSAHLDGIPCGLSANPCSQRMSLGIINSEYPTYEWHGVINPSSYYGPCSGHYYQYINGENVIYIDDTTYEVLETIIEPTEIVSADDCLQEIPKAISYDMTRFINSTYEVYSAELRYIPLHEYPHPEDIYNGNRWTWADGEVFLLVPVWEFSLLVKRGDALQEDSSQQKFTDMYRYTVYINALTGESMYSNTHGPADIEYWPVLYDPNV